MSHHIRDRVERDLARQTAQHHMKRERQLERLLAGFIAAAKAKPRCKCEAAVGLRHLAHELEAADRRRK